MKLGWDAFLAEFFSALSVVGNCRFFTASLAQGLHTRSIPLTRSSYEGSNRQQRHGSQSTTDEHSQRPLRWSVFKRGSQRVGGRLGQPRREDSGGGKLDPLHLLDAIDRTEFLQSLLRWFGIEV